MSKLTDPPSACDAADDSHTATRLVRGRQNQQAACPDKNRSSQPPSEVSPPPQSPLTGPPDVFLPPRFQFSLRTLLYLMFGLAVFMSISIQVGPQWSWFLVLFIALISLHVFANAWGSHIPPSYVSREFEAGLGDATALEDPVAHPFNKPFVRATMFPPAPITKLQEKRSLGKWAIWGGAAGGLAGAVYGAYLLWQIDIPSVSLVGYAVGIVSCGIIGAWLTFLVLTFITMSLSAWLEATTTSQHQDKSR